MSGECCGKMGQWLEEVGERGGEEYVKFLLIGV